MAKQLCYNRGCGKEFNIRENGDEACRFHPGIVAQHTVLSCVPSNVMIISSGRRCTVFPRRLQGVDLLPEQVNRLYHFP